MRNNRVLKITMAAISLLLLIINFSQLDFLVTASSNSKVSFLLNHASTVYSHLLYRFQNLFSIIVFSPILFCLNHPAFSVIFLGFATYLIIELRLRIKQKMPLVRSEFICYNMVPGFDGDEASQGEAFSTKNPDQTTDVATPKPAADVKGDENKSSQELSVAGRILENREYHPAFLSACKLVWDPEKLNLTYFEEHAVTVEPIRTDILILKKDPDEDILDQIGSFFRTYNFIQFKSDGDTLKPDDILKEINYDISFNILHSNVQFDDCTLTIFCSPNIIEVLAFLEKYNIPVRYGENPNIIYVDLSFHIKMQIVTIGNLFGRDNEYAPFNMFSGELDDRRILDLAKYKETYIKPDEEDRLKELEVILTLFRDKKGTTLEKIINHLKEENKMSQKDQEEMCDRLFPEYLAKKDEEYLNDLLKGLVETAKECGRPVEDLIRYFKLPKWCSREEALRRMRAM